VKKRKRKKRVHSFIHTERREVGDGIGVTTDVVAAANAQLISLPILLLYHTYSILL
jgi:hypothetical protein